MIEPLPIRVRNALTKIQGPGGVNIVASGIVQGLTVDDDGHVRFTLEFPADIDQPQPLLAAAEAAAQDVDGVTRVSAVATAHSNAPKSPPRPIGGAPGAQQGGGHDNPFGMRKKPQIEEAAQSLTGIEHVIAIASGKGGVGKSTLAANLAIALARAGKRTGFLDADIYGPSAPTLFGVHEKARTHDGKIMPAEAHGVRIMSVGMIVDPDQALAWRGPMVMGALKQLMRDVEWGELDVLIIDTPPGTGDAHLSLIQSKQLTGAVVVSTPQEMALADVRRGIALFRKTKTPVLGVIENMAWLETSSGEKQYLFGEGGAQKAAMDLDAHFLGAVPLFPDLRIACDNGQPPDESHPASKIFKDLAAKILDAIG